MFFKFVYTIKCKDNKAINNKSPNHKYPFLNNRISTKDQWNKMELNELKNSHSERCVALGSLELGIQEDVYLPQLIVIDDTMQMM